MIEKTQIEEFVRQARRVGAAGLTTCSSGNLSWRIGDEALVSGTGSWLPELVEEKVSICKVETGEVRASIDCIMPITEAEAAQDILLQRRNIGKVVMQVC